MASITILDDLLPEIDETIKIQLAHPVNAVLSNPSQDLTLTIVDDDIQISFAVASQSAKEAAGMVLISIIRSGGLSYPAGVDYVVSSGTALAGTDYLLAPGRVNFCQWLKHKKTYRLP